MRIWIKRLARILSIAVFFAVLLAGINPEDPFNTTNALWALIKAVGAFSLFWLAGFILGDIILKGAVETLDKEDVPVYEGGLAQRLREQKETLDPDAKALRPKETARAFAERERKRREEIALAAEEASKKKENLQ